MKAEAALLIALADIGGVWPVMRATRALTELADTAVDAAVRYLLRDAARARQAQARRRRRGRRRARGYIVLAMGKMGAFELNYSSDIDLIVFYDPRRAGARRRGRGRGVLRPPDARPGEAAAGAHRRRLRVPRRPAAAARSGLDPDRGLDRGGARLLRERRPELGARGDDQGARLRRRHRGRRGVPRASSSPFVWRKYLDFAAVADIHAMKRQIHAYRGHERDRGRGPQHQARPRRHPRDRVLRADPAADRRRPPSRAARPRDAGDARRAGRRRLDRRRRARRARRGLSVPAHGRAPPADGGRRADPHAAGRSRRRSNASRALPASRTATPSREVLLEHLRKVQRHYSRLFEDAAGRADQLRCRFRRSADDRETLDRLAAMGFRKPLEVSAHGAALARRRSYPSLQERIRARAARRTGAAAARAARAVGEPGRRADRLRPLPRRPAGAAARLFVAAAAESRSGRADRADARHRAAARRHPGALSAGDGRAARSDLLRRAAGRRRRSRPSSSARSSRRAPTRTSSTACACSARSTCS